MARSARSTPLDTPTGRFRLPEGKRHAVTIGKGLILVYRRGSQSSTWHAKIRGKNGRYAFHALGQADDRVDANGDDVLSFFQAQDRARAHAEHAKQRPVAQRRAATVHQAADHYLAWHKENRKAYTATCNTINAHILPSLGDRHLAELTTEELKQWRDKLARNPPRKWTARGQALAFRAAPTTEDAKRARRATANRI